jgi:hypothetical protein
MAFERALIILGRLGGHTVRAQIGQVVHRQVRVLRADRIDFGQSRACFPHLGDLEIDRHP